MDHSVRSAGRGREKFKAPLIAITADVVVLGAGTLGSTEILLRSAQHGLAVSNQLGQRFTGNGDVLAFGYNTARQSMASAGDIIRRVRFLPLGRASPGSSTCGISR